MSKALLAIAALLRERALFRWPCHLTAKRNATLGRKACAIPLLDMEAGGTCCRTRGNQGRAGTALQVGQRAVATWQSIRPCRVLTGTNAVKKLLELPFARIANRAVH